MGNTLLGNVEKAFPLGDYESKAADEIDDVTEAVRALLQRLQEDSESDNLITCTSSTVFRRAIYNAVMDLFQGVDGYGFDVDVKIGSFTKPNFAPPPRDNNYCFPSKDTHYVVEADILSRKISIRVYDLLGNSRAKPRIR